ncbi:MAG: HpcH/HpaI aldolase/citrate lyase family protein, partial [Dehalococcoidia bacterium]
MRPLRSLLYVPGNRPDRMEKAPQYGADGLILDLEDSVPPPEKPAARENVKRYLEAGPPLPVFVRIEGWRTPFFEDDVDTVVRPGLIGIRLTKVEDFGYVQRVDQMVTQLETERHMEPGSVALMLSLETPLGIRSCYDLLSLSPRIIGTSCGTAQDGDLIRELGATWTPEGTALLYARSKVLLDARAAGKEVIMDGVFANIQDEEALAQDTRLGKQLGYTGRLAIHPRQIPIINEIYTPRAEEVEYSRGLVEAFREAE